MKKHQSIRNAFKAEHSRACSCKAYVDIHNKTRWLERGFTPLPTAKPTVTRSVLPFRRIHASRTRPAPARLVVRCKLYCRCEVWPPRPASVLKAA
ncbi:MAG TPA: hypothetical protein VF507_02710 [Pyrinomonadaceae bacterium]